MSLTTLVAATLMAILVQVGKGYYNLELALYAKGVFLQIGGWLVLMAGLAFLMQVFFNQKFVGFLGVMVWFVLMRILPAIDFEHRLYRFASTPPSQYSDMNGFGHFTAPLFWFNLYWLLLVGGLLVVGHLFWTRGTEGGFRERMRIARQRFARPAAATLFLLFAAFAATVCYILLHTNRLNAYRPQGGREGQRLREKYHQFETAAYAHTDCRRLGLVPPAAVYIRGGTRSSTRPIRHHGFALPPIRTSR